MSVSSIAAPHTPRPKPRFIFSDQSSVIDTYESYAKDGFIHSMTNQANFPYEFEKQFLSKVDLTKGPILVSVGTIIRTIAVDWGSPKRERKEYVYYTTKWEAKDRLGNIIRCSHENEGKYIQQTKRIKTKTTLAQRRKRHIMKEERQEMSTVLYGIRKLPIRY